MDNIEKIQEYVPTVYVNDSEPDLDETNLNKAEEAIKRVTDAANNAIQALKQLEEEKLSLSAISNVLSDATDKVPSLALVKTLQDQIDITNSNLDFSGTAARIIKFDDFTIASTATQNEINAVLDKLNAPTSIFGNAYNIYVIKLNDQKGVFCGGNSYILGYTYNTDLHGAQLVLSYSGLKVRYKRNGVWTDLTTI